MEPIAARRTSLARRLARRLLPLPARRWIRGWIEELPERMRDLPADLRDALALSNRELRLPPPPLRGRVGRTRSRREFESVGSQAARDLAAAFEGARAPGAAYPRWLDFGCGSGRAARALAPLGLGAVYGVDVDAGAIAWARRNLGRDRFRRSNPEPPLPFPDGFFDLAFALSVFTHLDERMQDLWLEEMSRILRPGGLFIASTHSEDLVWTLPHLHEGQRERLRGAGFLFVPGGDRFNDDSTFHTKAYLDRAWGNIFEPKTHLPHGLAGFQDLSVWRRRG